MMTQRNPNRLRVLPLAAAFAVPLVMSSILLLLFLADAPKTALTWAEDLTTVWLSPISYADTASLAWGDWDNDGDLDLAAGYGADNSSTVNQVFANDGGTLVLAWTSPELQATNSVAWGDWDADGDLDLAVGNRGLGGSGAWNRVYENTGGDLTLAWTSLEQDGTYSVAWGDWNKDGRADLAVGNTGAPVRVYASNGVSLTLAWTAPLTDSTRSVAWADWDNDNDLDLAVGNNGQANRVYENDGGTLALAWSSLEMDSTYSVAWGDWDGDDYPELAVGNQGRNRVYNNGHGSLSLAWTSVADDSTRSVAWGDRDGDGDLDLAVGNADQPNQVYANRDANLSLAWHSPEAEHTLSMAWGDWDNDGDLDLAAGNNHGYDRVYGNGASSASPTWASDETDDTQSLAWGDWDGDGDLDLATGNLSGTNKVYANAAGTLALAWTSAELDDTRGLAWGDWDADGDLDLAVGNDGQPNQVYANNGISLTLAWTAPVTDATYSLAWGDWDGDGDLDLAVGNTDEPNLVYTNTGMFLALAWTAPYSEATRSLAWGDWDGDHALDLAVGNDGEPNRVYTNTGGNLMPAWTAAESDATRSLAWGDGDGDGDPDLAVGNFAEPNKVYTNTGGALALTWTAPVTDATHAVGWGDWDGDGDLDLAVGNYGELDRVYVQSSGGLTVTWTSPAADGTQCLAWGDWDGDGDLDLATGTDEYLPVQIHANESERLALEASSQEQDTSYSVAWGDWDGDGDLDLAVTNEDQPNRVYVNTLGQLSLAWSSPEADDTRAAAWGDWDGDGDLDLGFANWEQENRLYANEGGNLTLAWSSPETDRSTSLAWADLDGDGDLDLAVGNYSQPNRIYANSGGDLSLSWSSAESDSTNSVAWADWDGDGDPDLAVGNDGHWTSSYQPIRVYANNGGGLELDWTSLELRDTRAVAWGDWDGDGDPDLAVANGQHENQVYTNSGGGLELAWSSPEVGDASSLSWGDWDNDGDPDLIIGRNRYYGSWRNNQVYRNDGGALSVAWSSLLRDLTQGVAWGDWDGDGDLDLAVGNYAGVFGGYPTRVYQNRSADIQLLPDTATRLRVATPGGDVAPFFSSATILQGPTIPISYTLIDPENDSARYVQAYYSLNGGGEWHPAVAAAGTLTSNLAASPTGTPHVYEWDIFASGVSGNSDNTVFRLDVYQGFAHPGPYQYPFQSARTYPFRVRGSQVRVVSGTLPMDRAMVLRLPAGGSGDYQPYRDSAGRPILTGPNGYLQGWGEIAEGDHLVALAPVQPSGTQGITATDSYSLYYSSAAPTPIGLDTYTVTALGVQTLTVSANNPLILFDLDISLEWDARYDEQYMSQLTFNLHRTSELLYDWTNGQAALGRTTVYHDRDHWLDAHVRIYATNRLRPNAVQGGLVTQVITDPLASAVIYGPGQVRMGAVWNRYGEPGGNLGEDWPRTLAHELGHYAFFLDDNYLGFDVDGLLIPVEGCPGAMTDPYRDDYSEFHPDHEWLPACENTLSHQLTGRSDWATITTAYPWLNGTLTNTGPSGLPLAVTEIVVVDPVTPVTALDLPVFYLSQEGHRVQPGASARAFLFQGEWVTDLGRPTVDQVLARGASVGDRVCVFEPASARLGCESITPGDEGLALVALPDWLPNVDITPVTSRTIAVTVTNLPAGLPLSARLYPVTDPAGSAISLTEMMGSYAGVFNTLEPAMEGYLQVWVEEAAPRREIVTDYALGGGPGYIRGRGGYIRGRGGYIRGRGAPATSADGQVTLFGDGLEFDEGTFFALQAATSIPSPPLWATVVGQGYRLTASAGAPPLDGVSISFNYLGTEVPPGEETWLKVYHWDGATWHQLPTRLDVYYNTASAPVQGEGLYAIMSSLEIPLLGPGWNLFAYPVQETRPVTEALNSIAGYFSTVYGHDVLDTADPWKVYDVLVPDWVNDLYALEFGHGYWISLTEAITLHLKGATTPDAPLSLASPPATYYGQIASAAGFTPTVGMLLTAWVDGNPCGQTETIEIDAEIVYSTNVLAEGPGGTSGCGALGRQVTFVLGSQPMEPTAAWDNSRLRELPLYPGVQLTALDDQVTTLEDTGVTVDVLGNDSGADLSILYLGSPLHGQAQSLDSAVIYTPTQHYFGTDVFTYTIGNSGGRTDSATVTVTVIAVNDPPTISHIPDQMVSLGAPVGPITFTVGDVDTPVENLMLTGHASDPDLVPADAFGFSGSGITRTLTVTPVSILRQTVIITVTISDGSDAASASLALIPDLHTVFMPLVNNGCVLPSSPQAAPSWRDRL